MSSTHTEYAVTRGEKVVGDTFRDVEVAKQHLAWVTGQMESIGLDPDVKLSTIEVTVTRGRPHVYREPEPEVEPEQPAEVEPDAAAQLHTEVAPPE